jgi:hypothetical protein
MKTIKNHWLALITTLGAVGMLMGIVLSAFAQTPPQPVLIMTPTGTNQFLIVITNGASYANYELFHTPLLGDPAYPWTLQVEGTLGQTNFSVNMGMMLSGYFKAAVGNDWDGDGVLNSMDGNPSDANVGALSITIDSPTNGTVFN